MKIFLNNPDFGQYNRKVVEAEIDAVDDARLPDYIADSTGKRYAMYGEYIPLTNMQAGALGEAGYLLQIPVKNLLDLHELLDTLTEYRIDTSILEKI